ncbi:hypothetical protein CCAX7_36580 [Capsulimonas corticalis]|uniref:Uncharacterized protein n=1 Tax=Capsulimonas corticalis TaxID=2219043 RepID=A0A402D1G9_9BACT|nr:hypothetical protein [Capsulimonas corticalis]BDI31607.1 hypothetical protein CCAX7_36580 [Capsulimonas corticalis]
MSIEWITAPKHVIDVVEQSVPVLLPIAIGRSAPNAIFERPHRVFSIDSIDHSESLNQAVVIAWRYLITENDKAIATAEALDHGEMARFSNVNVGPFVSATADAIRLVEALPEVSRGQYEFRLLHFGSEHTVTVWLRGIVRDFTNDLMIALNPSPVGLKPMQAYSPLELFSMLRSLHSETSASDL